MVSASGAELGAQGYNFGTSEPNSNSTNTQPSGTASRATSGVNWKNSAVATLGQLSASASTTSRNIGFVGPTIQSSAYWFDQLVITAPGVPEGTIGEARVRLYFEGSVKISPNGYSDAQPRASVSYRFAAIADGADGVPDPTVGDNESARDFWDEAPVNIASTFLNKPRELVITFRFGRPLDLTVAVYANARLVERAPGFARAEIRCTGWNGFDSVVIRYGAPVTDYTVTSTSGFNFAGPSSASFNTWGDLYGLSGADAALTADPNGNGLPNVLEYALGRHPGSSDGGLTATTSGSVEQNGARYLSFSFTRPAGGAKPGDINYALERATSLANPDWIASPINLVTHSVTPGPGASETVILRSTHPASQSDKEFLRLKVTPTTP